MLHNILIGSCFIPYLLQPHNLIPIQMKWIKYIYSIKGFAVFYETFFYVCWQGMLGKRPYILTGRIKKFFFANWLKDTNCKLSSSSQKYSFSFHSVFLAAKNRRSRRILFILCRKRDSMSFLFSLFTRFTYPLIWLIKTDTESIGIVSKEHM